MVLVECDSCGYKTEEGSRSYFKHSNWHEVSSWSEPETPCQFCNINHADNINCPVPFFSYITRRIMADNKKDREALRRYKAIMNGKSKRSK